MRTAAGSAGHRQDQDHHGLAHRLPPRGRQEGPAPEAAAAGTGVRAIKRCRRRAGASAGRAAAGGVSAGPEHSGNKISRRICDLVVQFCPLISFHRRLTADCACFQVAVVRVGAFKKVHPLVQGVHLDTLLKKVLVLLLLCILLLSFCSSSCIHAAAIISHAARFLSVQRCWTGRSLRPGSVRRAWRSGRRRWSGSRRLTPRSARFMKPGASSGTGVPALQ